MLSHAFLGKKEALIILIEELTQRRITINDYLIKQKSLWFYKQMTQLETFTSASRGDNWLAKDG